MFTKEDYTDWRSNKVTKELVTILAENRQGKLEDIANGKADASILFTTIGQAQGLKDAVEFLLNMNGELSDLFIEERANG